VSVVNRCPHCGQVVAVRHGRMGIHGPHLLRCRGSREIAKDTDPDKWPDPPAKKR